MNDGSGKLFFYIAHNYMTLYYTILSNIMPRPTFIIVYRPIICMFLFTGLILFYIMRYCHTFGGSYSVFYMYLNLPGLRFLLEKTSSSIRYITIALILQQVTWSNVCQFEGVKQRLVCAGSLSQVGYIKKGYMFMTVIC